MTTNEIIEALFNMKSGLLNNIEFLGRNLPSNTLDELIDQLGGPSQVAEVRDAHIDRSDVSVRVCST